MENEENVKESGDNSTESTESNTETNTGDEQVEATDQNAEQQRPQIIIENSRVEDLLEEIVPKYKREIIETKDFKLEVSHYITAGDMLVSTLLAANIAVMLICRLLRDRK